MAMPLAAAPYRASGLVHWHFSDMRDSLTMSAHGSKADIPLQGRDFRFWPWTDIAPMGISPPLGFDLKQWKQLKSA
jgi:hypothetical protein